MSETNSGKRVTHKPTSTRKSTPFEGGIPILELLTVENVRGENSLHAGVTSGSELTFAWVWRDEDGETQAAQCTISDIDLFRALADRVDVCEDKLTPATKSTLVTSAALGHQRRPA